MDGLIESFVRHLRFERNYSEGTVVPYRSDVEEFSRYWKSLDCGLTWQTLGTDVIRDWMVELMDRGLKASAVCRKLSAVKTFYRYLLKNGVVKVDPAHLVKAPKKDIPLPYFVGEKEMDTLLDDVKFPETFEGMRDHLIIQILYATGIRAAELLAMDMTDVDMDAGEMRVTGKRNKERIVPFGAELAEALEAYMYERCNVPVADDADNACLIVSTKGRKCHRMRYEELRLIVRNALGNVTMMKKRSPHVLRHSFATSMLNNDADLESVKQLLGHESLRTTAIYTHTSFADLKKMYNKAHPRA